MPTKKSLSHERIDSSEGSIPKKTTGTLSALALSMTALKEVPSTGLIAMEASFFAKRERTCLSWADCWFLPSIIASSALSRAAVSIVPRRMTEAASSKARMARPILGLALSGWEHDAASSARAARTIGNLFI